MNRFSIIMTILAIAITSQAQTAFTVANSHDRPSGGPSELSAPSLRNPWVGGRLVYNIQDDVSDFFRLSGRFQFAPIQGTSFAIPFVTNFDLSQDSAVADEGVELGIFPWVALTQADNFALIGHGGLNYTMTTGPEPGDLFTISAGLELAIWGKDSKASPITISASPTLVFHTGEIQTENTLGLEMTAVFPVANGLGILIEGTVPFDDVNYFTKGIRAGVITNLLID